VSGGKTNGTNCNQGGAGLIGQAGGTGGASAAGNAGTAFRIWDNGTTTL
jgi:hypothetical protein